MSRVIPVVLLAIAVVVFPRSVHQIFLETGIERQLGTVQKIFYFHVPSAYAMYIGFGVSAPRDVRRYVELGADAVIVGSALVRLVGGTPRARIEDRVASFTRRLKRETRRP